jgi:predicted nucleic acid-binding protein
LLSELVPVDSVITECRDPKDNKFLELAVDAQVDYLVSGDKDLLVLDPFRGIPVLSAQDFLVVTQAESA